MRIKKKFTITDYVADERSLTYEDRIEQRMQSLLTALGRKSELTEQAATTWEEFICISLMQCLHVEQRESVALLLKTSSSVSDLLQEMNTMGINNPQRNIIPYRTLLFDIV